MTSTHHSRRCSRGRILPSTHSLIFLCFHFLVPISGLVPEIVASENRPRIENESTHPIRTSDRGNSQHWPFPKPVQPRPLDTVLTSNRLQKAPSLSEGRELEEDKGLFPRSYQNETVRGAKPPELLGFTLETHWPMTSTRQINTNRARLGQARSDSSDRQGGPEQWDGSNAYLLDSGDTLEALLNFLKVSGSPVDGLLELRSLLLVQREEKIVLRSLVDQMRVDLQGIRYQLKLQSEEIQVHAQEITHLRMELDRERGRRSHLETRLHFLILSHRDGKHDTLLKTNPFPKHPAESGNGGSDWNDLNGRDSPSRPLTRNQSWRKGQPPTTGNGINLSESLDPKEVQTQVFRGLKLLQTLLRDRRDEWSNDFGRQLPRDSNDTASPGFLELLGPSTQPYRTPSKTAGRRKKVDNQSHPRRKEETRKHTTMVSQLQLLVHTLVQEMRSLSSMGRSSPISSGWADHLDLFTHMRDVLIRVFQILEHSPGRPLDSYESLGKIKLALAKFELRTKRRLSHLSRGRPERVWAWRRTVEDEAGFQKLMKVTVALMVELRSDVNRLKEGQFHQRRVLEGLIRSQSNNKGDETWGWEKTSAAVAHLASMTNQLKSSILSLAQIAAQDPREITQRFQTTAQGNDSPFNLEPHHEFDMANDSPNGEGTWSAEAWDTNKSPWMNEADLDKIKIAKRQIDEKIHDMNRFPSSLGPNMGLKGRRLDIRTSWKSPIILQGLREISRSLGRKSLELDEFLRRRRVHQGSVFPPAPIHQSQDLEGSSLSLSSRLSPSMRNESSLPSLSRRIQSEGPRRDEEIDRMPSSQSWPPKESSRPWMEIESEEREKFLIEIPTAADITHNMEIARLDSRKLHSRLKAQLIAEERSTREGHIGDHPSGPHPWDDVCHQRGLANVCPLSIHRRLRSLESRSDKTQDLLSLLSKQVIILSEQAHFESRSPTSFATDFGGSLNTESTADGLNGNTRVAAFGALATMVEELSKRVKWLVSRQSTLDHQINRLDLHRSEVASMRQFLLKMHAQWKPLVPQLRRKQTGTVSLEGLSSFPPDLMSQVIEVLGAMDASLEGQRRQLRHLIDSTPASQLTRSIRVFERKLDTREHDEQGFRLHLFAVLDEFEKDLMFLKHNHLANSTSGSSRSSFERHKSHLVPGADVLSSQIGSQVKRNLVPLLKSVWKTAQKNSVHLHVMVQEMKALAKTIFGSSLSARHKEDVLVNSTVRRRPQSDAFAHFAMQMERDLQTIRLGLKGLARGGFPTHRSRLPSRVAQLQRLLTEIVATMDVMGSSEWLDYLSRKVASQLEERDNESDVTNVSLLTTILRDHQDLRVHVGELQSRSRELRDIKSFLIVIAQSVRGLFLGLDSILETTNHADSEESLPSISPRVTPNAVNKKILARLNATKKNLRDLLAHGDLASMSSVAKRELLNGIRSDIANLSKCVRGLLFHSTTTTSADDPSRKRTVNAGFEAQKQHAKALKAEHLVALMHGVQDVHRGIVSVVESVSSMESVDNRILHVALRDVLGIARELHKDLVELRRGLVGTKDWARIALSYNRARLDAFESVLRSVMDALERLNRAFGQKFAHLSRDLIHLAERPLSTLEMEEQMDGYEVNEEEDEKANAVPGTPVFHRSEEILDLWRKMSALESWIETSQDEHQSELGGMFSQVDGRLQRLEVEQADSNFRQAALKSSLRGMNQVVATLVDQFVSPDSKLSTPLHRRLSNCEARLDSLENITGQHEAAVGGMSLTGGLESAGRKDNNSQTRMTNLGRQVLDWQHNLGTRFARLASLVNGLETKVSRNILGNQLEAIAQAHQDHHHSHGEMQQILNQLRNLTRSFTHWSQEHREHKIRQLGRIRSGLKMLSDQVEKTQLHGASRPQLPNEGRDEDNSAFGQILRQALTQFNRILAHLADNRMKNEPKESIQAKNAPRAEDNREQSLRPTSAGVSRVTANLWTHLVDDFLRTMYQSHLALAHLMKDRHVNEPGNRELHALKGVISSIVESTYVLKKSNKSILRPLQGITRTLAELERRLRRLLMVKDLPRVTARPKVHFVAPRDGAWTRLILSHDSVIQQLMDYVLFLARQLKKGLVSNHDRPLVVPSSHSNPLGHKLHEIRRFVKGVNMGKGPTSTESPNLEGSSRNLSLTLTRLEKRLQSAHDWGQMERDSRNMNLKELGTLLQRGDRLKADLQNLLTKAKAAKNALFARTTPIPSTYRRDQRPPRGNLSDEPTWSSNSPQGASAQSQRWDSARPHVAEDEEDRHHSTEAGSRVANASFQQPPTCRGTMCSCCPSLRRQMRGQQSKLTALETGVNQSLRASHSELHHLIQSLSLQVNTGVLPVLSHWMEQTEWLRQEVERIRQNNHWNLNPPPLLPRATQLGLLPWSSPQKRTSEAFGQSARLDDDVEAKIVPGCFGALNGIYELFSPATRVRCQDSGIVMQNRPEFRPSSLARSGRSGSDGSQAGFHRNWTQYVNGFGSLYADQHFWLGLKTLHYLSSPPGDLQIDLWLRSGVEVHARCRNVTIGAEEEDFILTTDGCSSDPSSPTSLALPSPGSGHRFSTGDHFLNARTGHCAKSLKGGWWFPLEQCGQINPNMWVWPNPIARSQILFLPSKPRSMKMISDGKSPSSSWTNQISLVNGAPRNLEQILERAGLKGLMMMGSPRTSASSSLLFPENYAEASRGRSGSILPTIQLNNINVFPKPPPPEKSPAAQYSRLPPSMASGQGRNGQRSRPRRTGKHLMWDDSRSIHNDPHDHDQDDGSNDT